MAKTLARMLFVAGLGGLALLLAQGSQSQPRTPATARLQARAADAERTVFLAGQLAEEDLVALSANLAASGHPGVFLIDAPRYRDYTRHFLDAFQAKQLIPVGSFAEGPEELKERWGAPTRPPLASGELWELLFPRASAVVLCPAGSRRLVLQSAVLAGALRAPLWICRDQPAELDQLRQRLTRWKPTTIYAVGPVKLQVPELARLRIVALGDEAAVGQCYRRLWGQPAVRVAANPADCRLNQGSMSLLAPWLAIQKRAPLLLTEADGRNVAELVESEPDQDRIDQLILAADLQSIPMERRLNPVPGKDEFIEMEPLTAAAPAPFSYSTGRLFHAHPGVVTLMLARQRLLAEERQRHPHKTWKALVVSNPGGSLPLLETFSRVTAFELENCGYRTTTRCGGRLDGGDELRRLLPEHDVFLWEGHHNTLIKDYGLPEWTEPLPPSFVFLQSCLALTDSKAHPLLERGAIGVVGSSTRIYSATGGAFSLAYFNALMYDQPTLGGALRQAKNFLLAYSLLKEKRLGDGAKLAGANLRSAWAFTLWGDPTFALPRPAQPRLPGVRCTVEGSQVVLHLPAEDHAAARVGRYEARMPPNGRLAGLVSLDPDRQMKPLVPLVFAEVPLPAAPPGVTPQLESTLPAKSWVFFWDPRRRVGHLLVAVPPDAGRTIRFRVVWGDPIGAKSRPAMTRRFVAQAVSLCGQGSVRPQADSLCYSSVVPADGLVQSRSGSRRLESNQATFVSTEGHRRRLAPRDAHLAERDVYDGRLEVCYSTRSLLEPCPDANVRLIRHSPALADGTRCVPATLAARLFCEDFS